MQNELDFDIKKHSDIDKTFRVNKIMSDFDLKSESVAKENGKCLGNIII